MWHIIDERVGHGALCGENKYNTLSTDDLTIVNCRKCHERMEEYKDV